MVMPPSVYPLDGFYAYTTDEYSFGIAETDRSEDANNRLTMTTPGTATGSMARASGSSDQVGEEGVSYVFTIQIVNAIPKYGYFTLQVPSGVGLPDDPNDMVFTCLRNCGPSSTLSYNYASATRLFTFENVFPTADDSIEDATEIIFQGTNFVNPKTSQAQYFTWASFNELGSGGNEIDTIGSLSIAAEEGECTINDIYPTDNVMIYGQPTNYTVNMQCNHDVLTDYGIKMFFPDDFYVVDSYRCEFELTDPEGDFNLQYTCNSNQTLGEIIIWNFLTDNIDPGVDFEFTINSIVNPGHFEQVGDITISTVNADEGSIDTGVFTMDADKFTSSVIWDFYVTPTHYGVGMFPVEYTFHIEPAGELWRGSYIKIELPEEVSFYDERQIEKRCGSNLEGFTYSRISCRVNGGKWLFIENGFKIYESTEMTDEGSLIPPTLEFTVDQFRNPRSSASTQAWNVTVYSEFDKVLYTWSETEKPTISMTTSAEPKSFKIDRSSEQNGEITDYTFSVQTTNYLKEGDVLAFELPYPVYFSEDSQCIGRSNNLRNIQPCTVSVDLEKISVDLSLPENFRRLEGQDGRQLQSTETIASGETFKIQVSQVKNPYSFEPTPGSVKYQVYTEDLDIIEVVNSGFPITNTEPGILTAERNGLVPADFRQGFATNYTLEIHPVNYDQNMRIELTLPKEIMFGESNIKCHGLQGTDSPDIDCETQFTDKKLIINNCCTYQRGNPGTLRFLLETLKNPSENIITSSFKLETFTSDEWALDAIDTNVTVNFYCEFPCASCNIENKTECNSCYISHDSKYFWDNACYEQCPDGYVSGYAEESELANNCTTCEGSCLTCSITSTNCTACIEGYTLMVGGETCREVVYWPFPFAALGLIFFVMILISECVTKRESRFKEAFIAFLSLPELGSWICFFIFVYKKMGSNGSTMLACLAIFIYFVINFSHAIIHPRKMVPQTLFSYKTLVTSHKCSTYTLRIISYIFSFKFSLILVSYFWLRPRFKGDYSALNWKQFNRFSLAFIFLPYPLMMLACAYFLTTEGMFSYAGFVSLEVVFLSSILAVLMLLDALSSIKCKTIGKKKTNAAIKVATGADYESDEDGPVKKAARRKVRRKDQDEFGDDYDSEDNRWEGSVRSSRFDGSQMDQETKRQILMLEDLAHQMREEKEQLRLEKERIKHEREEMNHEKLEQADRMEKYMQDYNEQTSELSRQVKQLESNKHELVSKVEERLEMGWKANEELLEAMQGAETARSQLERDEYARIARQLQETQGKTNKLDQQVEELKKQRVMYQDTDSRISQGFEKQEKLITELAAQKEEKANKDWQTSQMIEKLTKQQMAGNRKSYKDVEGEMEDYEPVEEDPDNETDIDVADHATLPKRPAFGQIDYYRQMDGEDQFWMLQLTPRAGGDSIMGQHDKEGGDQHFMWNQGTAQYDTADVPPSRNTREEYVHRDDASHSYIASHLNREKNDSHYYDQRSDALHEEDRSMITRQSNQKFFNQEAGVFSEINDVREKSDAQDLLEREPAHFGKVEDPPELVGNEIRWMEKEAAAEGEPEGRNFEKDASQQRFFKPDNAEFDELSADGNMARQATPQQYFTHENPDMGRAEDEMRSGKATTMNYFNKDEMAHAEPFGDEDRNRALSGNDQRGFIASEAHQDDVSNAARDLIASQQYMEKERALVSRDPNEFRSAYGNSQFQMEQTDPYASRDEAIIKKEGTAQKYFKADEAARGDMSSQDKSIKGGTQMKFNQLESADFGKPDDYSRQRHGSAQEQFDNLKQPQRDVITPITAKEQHQDYFEKEDAEFGRKSMANRAATTQKYFEQEEPMRGKDSNYERKDSHDQEYNPTPLQDSSGRSVSEEGDIANANPFNQVNEARRARPNQRHAQPAEEAEELDRSPKKHKKTILYSDKSESSIDEMMGDTPSNYNIPNGRLDGKSLGLKVFLLNQDKSRQNPQNRTMDAAFGPPMGKIPEIDPKSTRNNQGQQLSPNLYNQPQSVRNSGPGGWGAINHPLGGRVPAVVGEESSGAGNTTGGNKQSRKQKPKVNKTFAEPALQGGSYMQHQGPGGNNRTPKPGRGEQNQPGLQRNNFV